MKSEKAGLKKILVLGAMMAMLLVVVAPVSVGAALTNTDKTSNSIQTACSALKSSGGIDAAISCVVTFFNYAVYLMMAAAVVIIVWGAFQMIYSEEKRATGRQIIYNGIIGLFVMISIWGFVNILDKTFGISDSGGELINKGRQLIK